MAQSFLNEDELYVPEDIIKEARSVIENLLPRKSVSLYEKEYNIFCAWRKSRNIKVYQKKSCYRTSQKR
jgi:hypothetical protein